ncbi:MAG TPA: hypothetical protein VKG62_06695 [Solirubrobacteraceae bacterium]|nr:hypothetical protein [Solirubrobacteraceae bacterium]
MTTPDADRSDRNGHYRSLSNFYLADPRRIASRERDLGLWWRTGVHGPMYRAAWVSDTGELYAVRLGPAADGTGEVEVLGRARDRHELERTLAGWRAACPQPDSMTWLRHRAAGLAAPETTRALSRELPHIALTGRRLEQARASYADAPGRSLEISSREISPQRPQPRRGRGTRRLALVGVLTAAAAPATALMLELAGG